jgi:hypothetical protein
MGVPELAVSEPPWRERRCGPALDVGRASTRSAAKHDAGLRRSITHGWSRGANRGRACDALSQSCDGAGRSDAGGRLSAESAAKIYKKCSRCRGSVCPETWARLVSHTFKVSRRPLRRFVLAQPAVQGATVYAQSGGGPGDRAVGVSQHALHVFQPQPIERRLSRALPAFQSRQIAELVQ